MTTGKALPNHTARMNFMPDSDQSLPNEIEMEVGKLISKLSTAGWIISDFRYDPKAFGSWYVDLCRDRLSIRLTKDRSQYFVDRLPAEELKDARLWRAFDNVEELQNAVIQWVG